METKSAHYYLPLISEQAASERKADEDDDYDNNITSTNTGVQGHHTRTHSSRRERRLLISIILLQAVGLIGLSLFTLSSSRCVSFRDTQKKLDPPSLLYSPAEKVVDYEVKVFTVGRENKTIYQGLSDDTDRAWGALYNHSLIKLPRSEAALLPNRTYPIKQEPGYYIAMLDVFHQLHCLNMIRQALHRDYYVWDEYLDEDHISHCVDSIRQSLMCNADISVNVWQWNEEAQVVTGHSSQAHTCKRFDKIWEWTHKRRMTKMFEYDVFVEDDLPNPPIIYN